MRILRPLTLVLLALALLAVGVALAARTLLGGDHIKAAIEAQASAALSRPVTIKSAVPRIFPRVSLDLREVVVGASREVVIDRILLSTGISGLVRRRVEDARISVERSDIDVPWALALIGALRQPAAAPSPASYPLAIESIGSISVSDVSLVAGSHKLLVNLQASLNGDSLEIQRMHGRSPETTFTAAGTVSSVSKRTGSLSIDAESMDLDGLLAFLVAATPAGARESGSTATPPGKSATAADESVPIDLQVDVRAARGRAVGFSLANLTTRARALGSDVKLENLKMDLLGGRYEGSAAFVASRGREHYEWRGAFDGLDVPQLMTFAGAAGAMTGRLSGSVALTAAGIDPEQAMRRARGTSRLAITDGRIPGLEIVRSVILAFGKPTGDRPGGSGEAFSRLAATVAIDGMNLSTSDLSFASRDLDMTGNGDVSLATQAIDFTTSIVLSQELSAQAGRDLYRLAREGDRIVVPARITGTVAAPTVFVDVKAALGRALRNQVEDRIRGLFDRWRRKEN